MNVGHRNRRFQVIACSVCSFFSPHLLFASCYMVDSICFSRPEAAFLRIAAQPADPCTFRLLAFISIPDTPLLHPLTAVLYFFIGRKMVVLSETAGSAEGPCNLSTPFQVRIAW